MSQRSITAQSILNFKHYLLSNEKSTATVEKYLRDVRAFSQYIGNDAVTKEAAVAYKAHLIEEGYAATSINSMLAAMNHFLVFQGWGDCKVKNVRTQRKVYCSADKELTKTEYHRLLSVSKRKKQLNLILQTICSTGIRVSEIKYFTVEAVSSGEVNVRCKSKTRTILVPGKLRNLLLSFAKQNKIKTGAIFITRTGAPVDRSNIWKQMKSLCEQAQVNPKKVFPHNLRKLFARTFYAMDKDIAKLADILGHGSIETTRIYIMTTGVEHRRQMERLGLLT